MRLMDNKTIQQQLDDIAQDICDNYCKYPNMPIPEGRNENWLINDDDSPCSTCPLTQFM